MMANLGMSDTLILMVLALVVFGPRRLPQIGRQIGKLMYEFRKASNDFKFQMDEEFRKSEEADRRKKEEEERQRALAAGTLPAAQLEPAAAQTTESGTAALETGSASDTGASPYRIYPNYPLDDPPTEEAAPPAVAEGAPTEGSALPAVAEVAPTDGSASPAVAEGAPTEGSALPAVAEGAPTEGSALPAVAESVPANETDAPVSAAEPAAAEPIVPRIVPRIQPPSTGETVAAERPGKVPEGKTAESAESEAMTSGPEAERSEPAAHHG